MAVINQEIKNILFFNSVRTATLAILDGLNGIKHWVRTEDGKYNEELVGIKFGNYEKCIELADVPQDVIDSGNFNFIPRLVLSFVGMTKESTRTLNKYHKISKRVQNEKGDIQLNYAYNSVPYDLQYQLVLQARGLNEAFQIVEQILPMFRPTYPLSIQEYPLFDEKTETVLSISDPQFDIMNDFGPEDVNIVNVTFDLVLKSNLYLPLQLTGPIETVIMMNYLWDTQDYKESQLASHYEFDVCKFTGKIYNNSVHRAYAPEKAVDVISNVEDIKDCELELSNINTIINTIDYINITTEDGLSITSEIVRNENG